MKGFHGGMSEEKTGSMDPWVKQQFFGDDSAEMRNAFSMEI